MDEGMDGWIDGWGVWESGQLKVEWFSTWMGAWRDGSLDKSLQHTYEVQNSDTIAWVKKQVVALWGCSAHGADRRTAGHQPHPTRDRDKPLSCKRQSEME